MSDSSLEAIQFGTDGWRATLDSFTTPRVQAVGQAVADHLLSPDAEPGTVAVGYDARESSAGFAADLAGVLRTNGFDVLVPERDVPTPVLAWTVRERGLAGGLMLTASHNPADYNGVKFLPAGGAPAGAAVTDTIVEGLRMPVTDPGRPRGERAELNMREPYLTHVRQFCARPDLSGLTVAYDAMHGSGRGVTDELLRSCGAEVLELRTGTDPTFGGVPPEPSEARLAELVATVDEGEATLGIANDGDADRIAVVTERGYLDANLLYCLLYEHLLERQSGDAVRTVSTTGLVDRVAGAHDHQAHQTAVGFKHVARAMAEQEALFGGEESGGFGVTDHLRNKDGVLIALLAARAHRARSIDRRVATIRDRFGDIAQDRLSVACPDEDKPVVLERLAEAIPERVADVAVEAVSDRDGFKLRLADGSWLLIRPSGTEPKLRVYAEAATRTRLDALLAAGERLVDAQL
jgi:phosphomannomutase